MSFCTRRLAYVLDSLVRVSRRVRWSVSAESASHPHSKVWLYSQGIFPKIESHTQKKFSLLTKIRSLLPPARAFYVLKPALQGSYLRCQYYPSSASFSTISSLLTLFSKFFSSFLRSTCSLSVSHKYLALEEVYLPFRAAFPSNPTHWKHTYEHFFAKHGSITLYANPVPWTYARNVSSVNFYRLQFCLHRFTLWADASSLAATKAILVSFFSSAYWYA